MEKRAFIKQVIPGRPMLIDIETVDGEQQVSITREQIIGSTWTTGWHGSLVEENEQYTFHADSGIGSGAF